MREFSAFEKQLIREISSGRGNNFPNLIDRYLRGVSISVNTQTNVATIIFESANQQQINNLPERLSEIEALIIQAVNLIKLFEDKGYIFTYTKANQIQNPCTYGTAAINLPSIPYTFPDQRISELLTRYSIQEIFVTPELSIFINDNFITREEKRFRKQFLLATIALAVALTGVFTNIFFNVKKEYFSNGQKIEQPQFEQLLKTIDNNKMTLPTFKDSLSNNKIISKDTTIIETVITTEVTTNSTIRQKKGSR